MVMVPEYDVYNTDLKYFSILSADLYSCKTWPQEELTEYEQEEIDYAIALSLSVEDQNGKAVKGEFGWNFAICDLLTYLMRNF